MKKTLYFISLFFISVSQADPIKLNNSLVSGGDVSSAQITPDGQHVIYIADQQENGRAQLYRVPISGGTPVRISLDQVSINNNPLSSTTVTRFSISPDGQFVVYALAVDLGPFFKFGELYSVPLLGEPEDSVMLVADPVIAGRLSGSRIQTLKISPDSQYVAFTFDREKFLEYQLLIARIGQATSSIELTPDDLVGGSLNSPTRIPSFNFSADSQRVVFQFLRDSSQEYEIHSSAIDGMESFKVTTDTQDADGERKSFSISADSQRIIYGVSTGNVVEFNLFSADIVNSGTPTQLSPLVFSYQFSPDGQTVVFTAPISAGTQISNLYSVPTTGGSITKISADVSAGGFGSAGFRPDFNARISEDSSSVIYTVDTGSVSDLGIFRTSINNNNNVVKLNDESVAPTSVQLSPDGQYVSYTSDVDTINLDELFSIRANGNGSASSIKLNAPLDSGQRVLNFLFSNNSRFVLYETRSSSFDIVKIYAVPVSGGEAILLSASLVAGGEIDDYQISNNDQHLIYIADQETDGIFELYSVSLNELLNDDSDGFCFPIKAQNDATALICL